MNLFDLTDSYQALLGNEELDEEVLTDTLDSISDARNVKWDNIASMIVELKAQSAVAKDKAKSWREQAQRLEKKADWLQSYLVDSMDYAGVNKLDGEHNMISVRNFRQSVVIDDDDAGNLNPAYIIKEEVYKPDKKLIYDDLKAGKEVQGAHLAENRKAVIK